MIFILKKDIIIILIKLGYRRMITPFSPNSTCHFYEQNGQYRQKALLERLIPMQAMKGLIEDISGFVQDAFFKQSFGVMLEERMHKRGSYLYIRDEKGLHLEKLQGVLGNGGCKKAIELEQGRVLMLPCGTGGSFAMWERVASEEVVVGKALSSIGLLSLQHKQVTVAVSRSASEGTITAYICDSFAHLATSKNVFIIDNKNPKSSTWKLGKNSLFHKAEDRLVEKKWDEVVETLLTDITKIFVYQIPYGGDSLNLAIEKNANCIPDISTPFKARFLGFDFTSKRSKLGSSVYQKATQMPDREEVAFVVQKLVNGLVNYEFYKRYERDSEEWQYLNNFVDRIEQKYTDEVLSRIKAEIEPFPLQLWIEQLEPKRDEKIARENPLGARHVKMINDAVMLGELNALNFLLNHPYGFSLWTATLDAFDEYHQKLASGNDVSEEEKKGLANFFKSLKDRIAQSEISGADLNMSYSEYKKKKFNEIIQDLCGEKGISRIDADFTLEEALFIAETKWQEHIFLSRKESLEDGSLKTDTEKSNHLFSLLKGSLRCFDFAFLKLHEERTYDFYDKGWPASKEMVSLLMGWGYNLVDTPEEGDLIVYGHKHERYFDALHYGIYREGKVISKWGPGDVYEHPLTSIPSTFGSEFLCMRKGNPSEL